MRAFHNLNPTIQGIFWILSTKLAFVLMMAIVKELSFYSSLQMNLIRSLLVLIIVLPVLLKGGRQAFLTKWPLYQFLRVALGAVAMISFFYAYRKLSMAKASALNFSFALVLPLFAIIFFKEKVKWQRWLVLIVGYLGVLLIIDPVFEKFEGAELVALLGVVCLAGDALQVKRIKTDSPYLMTFYSACMTILLLGPYFLTIPFFPELHSDFLKPWQPLQTRHVPVFVALGAIAFWGQYSYIHAYRQNRLNFVAGFDYSKLIFGTLIGLLFFKEVPSWETLLGGLIILICSYILTRQELRE